MTKCKCKTQREGEREYLCMRQREELYLCACVRQSERDASPTGRHYTASTLQPPQTPQPASRGCQQAWPLGNTGQQERAPLLKDKQHLIILMSSFGRLYVTSIQRNIQGGFEPQDKGLHHIHLADAFIKAALPLSHAHPQRSYLQNKPSIHHLSSTDACFF